ncbi:MAG: bacillithiol biosynthesis cysteine-adding enzyme BshC [Vulcanimicrobiota bacterium]
MKISFENIPRSTDLFLDYIYNFEKVAEFYARPPYDDKAYKNLFHKLEQNQYQREKLVEILSLQNEKFGNTPRTISSIERLRDPKTFVVFTGQQVGLFGGPLYTIYKAMTTINMARYLSLTTNYNFLPLFWVEGEDHDFEEIRKTCVVDKNNDLMELTYEPHIPHAGQCVGEMILDDTIQILIEKYASGIYDSDYKKDVLNALKECYKPGKNLAGAFASWLAYLVGAYGLILVDPSHPDIKKIALPAFKTSLEKHDNEINQSLEKTNKQLLDSGYHVQVNHRRDTLDFFYHTPKRVPITLKNEKNMYIIEETGREFSKPQLMKFLEENIQHMSPNVILRPLIQDRVFPTAAYVAGPSEIAYFAQYKGLYEIFNTPMPVIYPRKSLTVEEKRIYKIRKKYNIEFPQLFNQRSALEKRVLVEQLPSDITETVDEVRSNINENLDKLLDVAVSFNKNLGPIVKKMKGSINKDLSHTLNRITNSFEDRDKIIKEHIDKIFVNLYPDKNLQERKLNILSYLYKYYSKFIYSLTELTCCQHDNKHILWKVEL